jgi:broad specificity phosphatase PhoE
MAFFSCISGQTEYNVKRLIQGQRGGDLTECGIQQAYALGERLSRGGAKEWAFDLLVVSDLHRTRQTAGAILESGVSVGYVLDRRLREKACGVLEGSPLGASERLAREAMGVVSSSSMDAEESHHRSRHSPRSCERSSGGSKISGKAGAKIDHHMVRAFRPEGGENWLDVNDRASDLVQSLVFKFPEFMARKREWISSEAGACLKGDLKRKKPRSSLRRLSFHVLVVTHGGWIKEMKNLIEHKDTNANNLRNTSLTTLRIGNIPAKYFTPLMDSMDGAGESVDCYDISTRRDREARRVWNECSRSFVLMNDASHIRDLDGFPVTVIPIPIPIPVEEEKSGDDGGGEDTILLHKDMHGRDCLAVETRKEEEIAGENGMLERH